MASLGGMTVTVKLNDKAQAQLEYMLEQIQGIRAEIADCEEVRRKLTRAKGRLALNRKEFDRIAKALPELDALRKKLSDSEDMFAAAIDAHDTQYKIAGFYRDETEKMKAERDALQAWKNACPWDVLYKIAHHSTVAYWTEIETVKKWIESNAPTGKHE